MEGGELLYLTPSYMIVACQWKRFRSVMSKFVFRLENVLQTLDTEKEDFTDDQDLMHQIKGFSIYVFLATSLNSFY